MAFNKNDIYVEGGDNKILHLWTPGVEKFDTSSFYNWEQDNIPLYDLEERTYYLWEKAGWPTSGSPQVSGVVFSVSADALGTQTYVDDPNLFLHLSGALNALPDIIRYPIRIEVGNFGDLGELVLNNIHFTGSGALEIVNRNFGSINPGQGVDGAGLSAMAKDVGEGAAVGYDSANTDVYVTQISSLDLSNTLADTSCLGVSTLVARRDGTETRWDDESIILGQMVHETKTVGEEYWVKTAKMTASLYHSDPMGATEAANVFDLLNYGEVNDYSISAYDISSVSNEIVIGADGEVMRTEYDVTKTYDETNAVGLVGEFYGNRLSKLEVNNCGGPIYIRNFAVDGGLGATIPTKHHTRHGININNSEVVLEHCAAIRCYETGFNLVNSNVILSRGAWAYRNYALSSNVADAGLGRDTTIKGVGFNLFNSNVVLSSVGEYDASGAAAAFASTRNDRGMVMYNSILTGGDKRLTSTDSQTMTSLQLFENSNRGLLMNSSKLDLNGAMDIWLHPVGIEATNSDILVDELYVDHTQTLGIELKNSHLVYAKNAPNIVEKTIVGAAQLADANTPQEAEGDYFIWTDAPGMVMLDTNGQHLKLSNSKYTHPRLTEGAGLSRCKYKRNRGASPAQTTNLLSIPAIILENNSLAHLTYARIQTQTGTNFGAGGNNDAIPAGGAGVGQGGTSNANYGACLLVKDNSTARLVGGSEKFTWLDGPSNYEDQIYTANAYVSNGSNLKVHGPTLMSRAGVNVLVDNDSVLDVCPPKDENGFIDNEQWKLTTNANQTKVDLQSSRACLVADNNSVINMEDCGDYNADWVKGAADEAVAGNDTTWYASGLVLSANYSTYETSAWHDNGSIQFYPNPQLQTTDAGGPGSVPYDMVASVVEDRNATDVQTFPLALDATGIATLSKGGMCLRSMKGSRVNVRNVNFPCGWNNTSALYYNYSLTGVDPQGCEQLRIWNIDSTSKLDMSYTSVSSHFPPLVGYNGPSAVYVVDGVGCTSAGVPDSTLYTSSLSVLDSFGSSGTPGNTHSDGQNFGPFRIYFAPKQFAKYLVYNNQPSEETGVIYQTIAQGYNMSGSCSSIFLTTSSGPDIYSVYGAGPTSPSGIQGAISLSSLMASAYFGDSAYGECKDFRNYTSAVAYTVSAASSCYGGLRGTFGSASADGIPGWPDPSCNGAYVQPYFKHYKESNFFYAKDLLPQDYDSRVILDESAIAIFANAKNATLGTAGRPKLVTMKTSTTSFAGEGAQSERDLAGRGFLSASEFDLNKLN